MIKSVITTILGTRHDRERKRLQPIIRAIHEHEARLANVSEDEVRAQTTKFREIIRGRTGGLETRAAELREAKRVATDPAEREKLDTELSGLDGMGGVEAEIRNVTAE